MVEDATLVASGISKARSALGSLTVSCEAVARGAEDVSQASQVVSQAMMQISGQASGTSADLRRVTTSVEEAHRNCEELRQKSTKINSILNVIRHIASQTNLLALNATIEAARAGDMGKGFAVVANEVKLLAGQAAKATEEISLQLGGVQQASEGTTASVEAIKASIGAISERMGAIAAAVHQQEASASEIAKSTNQTTSGVRELRDSVEILSRYAKSNNERAEGLVQKVGQLASLRPPESNPLP